MTNERGKEVDSTYLDIEKAIQRGLVHRDYIAHLGRFSHVLRHLSVNHPERIVDAGTGRLSPLSKVLYVNRQTSHKLLAIDVGPINPDIKFAGEFQPIFWPMTDIATISTMDVEKALGGPATLVTSFEVCEHMEPHHMVQFLRKLFDIAYPKGELLISTPCYDPKTGAAANHVDEVSYHGFGTTLEMIGFTVKAHYGTFASQKDLLPFLSYGESEIFHRLEKYYDTNLLSVMFAPLYPQHSRNVLWHLTTKPNPLPDDEAPWRIDLRDAWQRRALGSSTNEAAWVEYGRAFGFC